jgi:hypothetical protein
LLLVAEQVSQLLQEIDALPRPPYAVYVPRDSDAALRVAPDMFPRIHPYWPIDPVALMCMQWRQQPGLPLHALSLPSHTPQQSQPGLYLFSSSLDPET